jgi:N-acetyl-alpha-D-muramate 1-phosphate uridylyltransferase
MYALPDSSHALVFPKRAMVFAAGLGTRMRPITEIMPKPLVKVAGKPMIDHMLDRLAAAGVETAVVNVHHHAEQIEAHLANRKRPKIIVSDERDKLLDQGGGIQRALPHFGGEPFFICNTDSLWLEGPRANLARLAAAWDPAQMDILLLVASSASSIGMDWAGDFIMDSLGRLARREERQVAPFAYSGVGIIRPELFEEQREDAFRLAPIFFDAAAKGRLFGQRLDGLWCHVGTPEMIAETERFIMRSVL